jgi:hypothetical protein
LSHSDSAIVIVAGKTQVSVAGAKAIVWWFGTANIFDFDPIDRIC